MWKIAVISFKEFTWKNSDGSIKMSQTCLIECIIKCFGIQRATTRATTAEYGALSSEKGEETGETLIQILSDSGHIETFMINHVSKVEQAIGSVQQAVQLSCLSCKHKPP